MPVYNASVPLPEDPAMPHLVVSITGHGYGHVAQTAPVLNVLHQHMPDLRMTIRSSASIAHLRSRIHAPFEHRPSQGDIGMMMTSALAVDVAASCAAYRAFHDDWETRVEAEAELLQALDADFVLSNVGYLPLAGAQRTGIPNAALCSLNWHDIYRQYCGDDRIASQIFESYERADAFLRATPGMRMTSLPNLVPVAPIAEIGVNRRDELNAGLQLAREQKLVLVSLGGITSRLPMEQWPRIDGVRWLVQQSWQVQHPDAIVLESLQMSFRDLLASCDALLTKPGYGSFVEAACSGTPVLYVGRPDWPEAPALVEWLRRNGRCREVSHSDLDSGKIGLALEGLLDAPETVPAKPAGVEQVAEWLAARMIR